MNSLDGRVREAEGRLRELEAKIAAHQAWVGAAEKIEKRATLTREEVAAYLGVSTKTVQRMDADREIKRCPGLRGVVRYAARDVMRLASATRRED